MKLEDKKLMEMAIAINHLINVKEINCTEVINLLCFLLADFNQAHTDSSGLGTARIINTFCQYVLQFTLANEVELDQVDEPTDHLH